MSARFDECIVKSCQFLQRTLVVGEHAEDGAPTCGSKVYGEEKKVVVHVFKAISAKIPEKSAPYPHYLIFILKEMIYLIEE